MRTANRGHLTVLLDPFAGGADDVQAIEQFGDLDWDNPKTVDWSIANYIQPYFEKFDPRSQKKVKESLAYFLSDPSTDFTRVFQQILVPFSPPQHARSFFLKVWERLFGAEPWQIVTTEFEVIEHPDPTELTLKGSKSSFP